MRRTSVKAQTENVLSIMSRRVARMTAKEQATLALKGFMFLLFIVGALWGHPPSRAQAPQPNVFQVVPVSGEDIKQDGDIAYMKALMDGDKTTIKEQLVSTGQQTALSKFVKEFKKKWMAKTECRSGYSVADCKGYKAPKSSGTAKSVE